MKDLTGRKFGRLTVERLSLIDKQADYTVYWECRCRCGAIAIIRSSSLLSGMTKSCGCLHSEVARRIQRKYQYKHGKTGTKVFHSWVSIRQRCNNPKSPAYKLYGGRGIKCLWKSFETFYRDMGNPPSPKHSIDRINNNGNYCKANCRWATPKEQAINRNATTWFTFKGQTLNQRQWAKKYNISYKTLHNRLKVRKWPIEKALTQPLRKMKNNRSFFER